MRSQPLYHLGKCSCHMELALGWECDDNYSLSEFWCPWFILSPTDLWWVSAVSEFCVMWCQQVNKQSRYLHSYSLREDWNKVHSSLTLEALPELSPVCFSDLILCHLPCCSLVCILLLLKLPPTAHAMRLLFHLPRTCFPPRCLCNWFPLIIKFSD